ncbi:MAG: hypothetical protein RR685_01325 [Hungatella sp.]
MIELSGIVGIPFLKKSRFTGSEKNRCFVLEKQSGEDGDHLAAVIWDGPNCCAATPDEQKTTELFAFTEEGIEAAAAWLNQRSGGIC